MPQNDTDPLAAAHAHFHQAVGQLVDGLGQSGIGPDLAVAGLIFVVDGNAPCIRTTGCPAVAARIRNVELGGCKHDLEGRELQYPRCCGGQGGQGQRTGRAGDRFRLPFGLDGGPVQQLQLAVVGFGQGGQAFYPIAVIAIQDAAHVAQFGLVDVPADHAVQAAAARLAGQRFLEIRDEGDGVLDLVLEWWLIHSASW
ncbi:hypothetical protein G6F31_015098 [Rhizopus arrhizus]|nr:hypothetical protein G6F31_015098 [Rhizopus arrhizus]